MASEFLNFLAPAAVEKSADTGLKLTEAERAFYLLNAQSNFYFRFPSSSDLRTITDSFKDEECFILLSEPKVNTIIGNANGVLKVQSVVNAAFNNHAFLKDKMVSRQYLLDLLVFPEIHNKTEESEAMREYEKAIRSNTLIKRKKHLLEGIGYTYLIHYDADKLANQVIEDVRKTSG